MAEKTLESLGRYKLQRVLGKGAMGIVYEGLDPRLNRKVAVKTILVGQMDEATANDYSMRFAREAQAVARLNHANIVQVYDYGEEGSVAFIVMEYVRGKELKSFFDAGEQFDIKDVTSLMCELLDALEFAHNAGVIHRDIKPANVMVDSDGHAKLADFGVARVSDPDRQGATQIGTMVGTPAYMSPEQVQGHKVDRRTDIFSAGVILYQFLTGNKPFQGGGAWTVAKMIVQDDPPSPSSVVASISPEYDRVISRALAKNPANRYQTAYEFSQALQRVLAGQPAADPDDTRPPSYPSPNTSWSEAPPQAPAFGESPSAEVELEFWQATKDTDDPEELDLYIQNFPNGVYVDLARKKMAQLRNKARPGAKDDDERLKREAAARAIEEAKEKARKAAVEQAKRAAEERAREAAEKAKREAAAKERLETEARVRREAEERQRLQALEKARLEAQEKARREAAEKLRLEAEAKARREAEEKARREAAEKARLEAEAKARRDAEEKARREAIEKARLEAQAKARREAEEKARREALEKARLEAEAKARREAEEKAQREAAEKARLEAEAKARREAEERARREAAERARLEAEAKARREAEERARREAAEKARLEAEAKARRDAEERARREAIEKARLEAEARARREAEERARREAAEKARLEAEAQARREAEEKARREAAEKARLEAEAKARREAEERARRDAEERARLEMEAKARREAEEAARQEAARQARVEAEQRAQREAEAKAQREADELARREEADRARKLAEQRAAIEAAMREAERKAMRAAEIAPLRLAREQAMREAREKAQRDAEERVRIVVEGVLRRQKALAALHKQAKAMERAGRVSEAVKIYQQATDAGDGAAARKLGEIFAEGAGDVSADPQEADRWFDVAESLGEVVHRLRERS